MNTIQKCFSSVVKHLFAASCALALLAPAAASAAPALAGSGTEASPYLITSAADMATLRDWVNAGNTCVGEFYQLTADIDMGGVAWTPIGSTANPFSGVFDGSNHILSGLKLVGPVSDTQLGLFGVVSGTANSSYTTKADVWVDGAFVEGNIVEAKYTAVIKNVALANVDVSNTSSSGSTRYTGALAGMTKNAYIAKVTVSGSVSGIKGVGGLVGSFDGSVAKECVNSAAVTAGTDGYNAGGIAGGANYGNALVASAFIDCSNSGKITTTAAGGYAGGIVGMAQGGTGKCDMIQGCSNSGEIHSVGVSSGIGGIVGQGIALKVISSCMNTGILTADASVACAGGIAGTAISEVYGSANQANITIAADYLCGIYTYDRSNAGVGGLINGCVNEGTLVNTSTNPSAQTHQLAANSYAAVYSNQVYADVAAVNAVIAASEGQNSIEFQNCTVTDKSGTLILNSGLNSIVSDTQLCIAVDVATGNASSLTVSIPGVSVTVAANNAGSLNILGANNTVKVNEGATVASLFASGNGSTVTNDGTVTSLSLGGSGSVVAVNNGTLGTLGFGGVGIYTVDNNGTISHTQRDSNPTANEHTCSTIQAGTITLNNRGTIEAIPNVNGIGSYALLFYNGATVVVNAYNGSVVRSAGGYFIACGSADSVTLNIENGAKFYSAGTEFVPTSSGKLVVQAMAPPVTYVAQIGETKYASINAAFAAVNGQAGESVEIKILADVTEELTDDYILNKSVTLATDVEGGVTVNLGFEYGRGLWAIAHNGSGKLAIEDDVTITNLGQLFAGMGAGGVVDIKGDVTAQQLWAYYGGVVNIMPTAKVVTGYGDGMVKFRYDSTINVTGNGQSEVQFAAGYFSADYSGAMALNLTNTYVTSAWLQSGATSGSFTLNLDNAKLVLNGALNLGANATGTINMTIDSIIIAKSISNVDVINIDATGLANAVKVIDYTGSGTMTLAQYGTVNVTGGEAYVESNDLWVREIVVAKIGVQSYASLQDAVDAVVSGQTITLYADNLAATLAASQSVTIDANGHSGLSITTVAGYEVVYDAGTYSSVRIVVPPVLAGSGTEASPYLIANLEELAALRDWVNATTTNDCAGEFYQLTADIDMVGVTWTPIGDDGTYDDYVVDFAGTFDGAGHTIRNFAIEDHAWGAALFGLVSGTIENLTIADSHVTGSEGGYALFAVMGTDGFTMRNCHAVNSYVTARTSTGLMVAYVGMKTTGLGGAATIEHCDTDVACYATQTAGAQVAGIVGQVFYFDTITISGCTNRADLTGNGAVGGIVGQLGAATKTAIFTGCANTGAITVTGGAKYAGGLVGYKNMGGGVTGLSMTFTDCHNSGAVVGGEAGAQLGGFVGFSNGTDASFTRCVNSGTIGDSTYLAARAAGFIAIDNSTTDAIRFEDCANAGTLTGTSTGAFGATMPSTITLVGTATVNNAQPTLFTGKNNATYADAYIAGETTTTYFADFADAVGAAASGDTITLLADGLSAILAASQSVTIDANGHSGLSITTVAGYKVVENAGTYTSVSTAPALAGSGTEASPYLIASLADLKTFRDWVNAGNNGSGLFFQLTTDIDLGGAEWTPIGTTDSSALAPEFPFSGMFDGQSHSISNFKVTTGYVRDDDVTLVGFFGCIHAYGGQTAGVKNLTLDGATYGSMAQPNTTVGALAPVITSDASTPIVISGVSIVNSSIHSFGYYGQTGLAAFLGANHVTVENCMIDIDFWMPNTGKVSYRFWSPGFGQVEMVGENQQLIFDNFDASACRYYHPTTCTLTGNGGTGTQTIWVYWGEIALNQITVFACGTYIGQIYKTGYNVTIDGMSYTQTDTTTFTYAGEYANNVRVGVITHNDFTDSYTYHLADISPDSATAGGGDITLTAHGSYFTESAKVFWNGTELATIFVSSTQLTAVVVAEYIATPGTASVTVGGTGVAKTFTVEEISVAQVGTTKYATLAEAVAALNQTAGQTLTLLADAEITAPIVISKDAVIDLNGFTLTSSGCAITVNVGVGSLELQNGDIVGRAGAIVYGNASNASTVQGVITLDNVDISATGGDAIAMYAYKGSFVLDLNSTNTITATTSGCDGIFVDCYYYNETAISGSGALTVSGANAGIHLSYSIPLLSAPNLKASGATAGGFKLDGTGSGGVVKGITAGMFANDVTANCADGYVCITSGDATYGYKVVDGSAYNVMATVNGSAAVYDTIAEAIAAAETDTVRIIVNNSLEENINVGAGQTVVIDAGTATIDGTIASAGTLVILNGDFTSDPTPWIDDGKEVVEGSGVFTVQTRDLEAEGDGAFHLRTLDDLCAFRNMVNDGSTFSGETVVLEADIDMSGLKLPWVTIGNSDFTFAGSFDGNGKKIVNLTYVEESANLGGLFRNLDEGSEVRNLMFVGANISGDRVATLANYAYSGSVIDGVVVDATSKISATSYAAGVIATASYGDMYNCWNYADVESGFVAAGIAGYIYGEDADRSQMTNCVNKAAKIVGVDRAGGIVAHANYADVSWCCNTATVEQVSGSMPAGGIVAVGSMKSVISYCLNVGPVKSGSANVNASAGGILGQDPSGSPGATTKFCDNWGDVTASQFSAGGVVMSVYGTTVTHCRNSGTVNGAVTAGGISAKPAYGSSSSSYCVVDAAVAGGTTTYRFSSLTPSSGYDYDGDTLKTVSGTETTAAYAVAALNAAANEAIDFWVVGEDGRVHTILMVPEDVVWSSPVAQIGDVTYASLAAAVAAVPDDGTPTTITMLADEEITTNAGVLISAGKNVVLDLNGKTIFQVAPDAAASYLIENHGTLTVVDSTATVVDGVYTSGKLTAKAEQPDASYGYGNYTIDNSGVLTIASGIVEQTSSGAGAYYALNTGAGATATISGGLVKASSIAVRQVSFGSAENTLNITGGEIESGYFAVQLTGMSADQHSHLNISGGTITTTDETYNLAVYVTNSGGSFANIYMDITGGTFNGDVATTGVVVEQNMSVSDGTFNGAYGAFSYGDQKFVSGGTFTGANAAETANYLEDGFVLTKTEAGYTVVPAVVTDTITVPEGGTNSVDVTVAYTNGMLFVRLYNGFGDRGFVTYRYTGEDTFTFFTGDLAPGTYDYEVFYSGTAVPPGYKPAAEATGGRPAAVVVDGVPRITIKPVSGLFYTIFGGADPGSLTVTSSSVLATPADEQAGFVQIPVTPPGEPRSVKLFKVYASDDPFASGTPEP